MRKIVTGGEKMLNIATINVQNKYKLKKYDGLTRKGDHVQMLLDLIEKYQLEIVGMQEVNERYFDRLNQKKKWNFQLVGEFRYPLNFITKHIYPFTTFNESTPVLTNQKILKSETITLPFLASLVPRVVTIAELEIKKFGKITILNTHLDVFKNKTKEKELIKLLEIIHQIEGPIILMGDFNMTIKNKAFKKFIENLEEKKIYRVPIFEKTYKKSAKKLAIDHVFLSDCFRVEETIIEKDVKYTHFSDHYPIVVKLSLGFPKK